MTAKLFSNLFFKRPNIAKKIVPPEILTSASPRQNSEAAVALILKIRIPTAEIRDFQQSVSSHSTSTISPANFNQFFSDADSLVSWFHQSNKAISSINNEHIPLDILLIKRSISTKDPWSGHIALPGGHIDHVTETPLMAAIRETREEIGIDLSSDRFQHMGELKTRVMSRGKRNVVVYPQVFIYLGALDDAAISSTSDLNMTLCKDEVMDAWWESIYDLNLQPKEAHSFPLSEKPFSNFIKLPIFRRIADLVIGSMSLKNIYFPSWFLKVRETSGLINPSQRDYVLWGMTFGIITDFSRQLVAHGFLPQSNVNTSKLTQYCLDLGFALDNKYLNSYLWGLKRVCNTVGVSSDNRHFVLLVLLSLASFPTLSFYMIYQFASGS